MQNTCLMNASFFHASTSISELFPCARHGSGQTKTQGVHILAQSGEGEEVEGKQEKNIYI